MEFLSRVGDAFRTLIDPLFQLLDQRNLFSYLGAAVFIFLAAVAIRLRRPHSGFRLRAFWRLLTKRTVWGHRSSRLDYKLYLVNLPLMVFVLGAFVVGSAFWADVFAGGLARLLGPAAVTEGTNWAIVGGIAIVQLLALDLGYWIAHAWMHRSEILWQFHKVHHSAEVMTPATEYRQHPVELILFGLVVAPVTGLSFALVTHWFGTGAAQMGIYWFNVITLVHIMTFHHVRHSHISMPFTGVLGVILHSPAHHHLHHSSDPAHFNRNMGYALSIWDWAAGTLQMPRRGQRLQLGIGAEGEAHDSVRSAFLRPFREAKAVMARRHGGDTDRGAAS
jgi:sterol desaturase/sphingolipid hydroxylase (fatty acid hydroxylase superfamily)